MGITASTKELNVAAIPCGGSFTITLGLTAIPDIQSNPTDIVLILDRSGSMQQSLPSLKEAAKVFIDIIDEATDGTPDGQIGSGSRIGIVSFADTATRDVALTTSVAALKTAVDALSAGGSTNHADAFTQALALFDPASTNAKVMVMFTDGVTTAGGPPNPVATLAKSQGVIIYSLGLMGNGGIDEQALRDWASDPDAAHVAIAPTDQDLEELFRDLARNIVNPGATNIAIEDVVSDCFRITAISAPTKGTATMAGSQTVVWSIDELGTTESESAFLTFTVQHLGLCSGLIPVNASITYADTEGNVVNFGDPEIDVDCGEDIFPEPCPAPIDITMDGCQEALDFDAGDLLLGSLGRILQLDVTLRGVCPGKRVALAVLLSEVDSEDNEFSRGMKTLVIPAHSGESCRDITVRCIKFVLPEELDVSGSPNALCDARNFRVRFLANYIDSTFQCCPADI